MLLDDADPDGRGSPTELADSDDEEKGDNRGSSAMETDVKKEKRKRESRGKRRGTEPRGEDGLAVPVGDDDDGDSELDSPSKRPQRGDCAPLSGQEIRDLLFGHAKEMKDAWRSFQGRLDQVETMQVQQNHEMINIRTRTSALEKQGVTVQKNLDTTNKNVDALAEEVKNMKVQLGDLQARPLPGSIPEGRTASGVTNNNAGAPPADPWADFLRRQGRGELERSGPPPAPDGLKPAESLTEDEKRTLVFGGWARDTKKSIIEQESEVFLRTDGMKALIDVDHLSVFGPRRSVGMMKFCQRDGETFANMKTRMWEVVRLVGATKLELPSTKEFGSVRTLWASFVKTKTARIRSSLVSQVRRITCELALEAKNAEGGIKHILNTQHTAYDCDWNLGTIWCGTQKLASSTHKAPRTGEIITLPGGWVSLDAIVITTGCTPDEAKQAFEREL